MKNIVQRELKSWYACYTLGCLGWNHLHSAGKDSLTIAVERGMCSHPTSGAPPNTLVFCQACVSNERRFSVSHNLIEGSCGDFWHHGSVIHRRHLQPILTHEQSLGPICLPRPSVVGHKAIWCTLSHGSAP